MARVRLYKNGVYDDYEIQEELLQDELREILEDDAITFAEVDDEPLKQPSGAMSVWELNRARLIAVKQEYYIHEHEKEGTSWGELAAIDELVTDAKIFEVFEGMTFTQDDFTG